MKKIIYLFTTLALAFSFFYNKEIKALAETTYHIVSQKRVVRDYNLTLHSGYYIFYNDNIELNEEMFLGDFQAYDTSSNHNFTFSNHITVENESLTKVTEMVEEYQNYYEVNKLSIDGYIMLVKVNSYAVFDPNAEDYFDILEIFYASEDEKNTDATIAGSKAHIMSIDQLIPIETIKERYTAEDVVDGDITDRLQFITDYDVNIEPIKPRNYYILVSVTDNAGNTTYAADVILVRDLINPVASLSTTEVTYYIGQTFTSTEAKKLFTFSDNYTETNRLAIFYEDEYESKYDRIGTYRINAYCVDESGNFSDQVTLTIKIIDNEAPIAKLKDNTNRIVVDRELSNEELLNLFVLEDNYYPTDQLTLEIYENHYDGRQGVDHLFIVEAIDPSNNREYYTFYYYVTDTEAPIINVKDTIYLEYGTVLSNEEFIELLQEMGLLPNDVSSIEITNEETNDNITTISFLSNMSDGTTKQLQVDINYYQYDSIKEETNNYLLPLILISSTTLLLIGCGLIVIYKKKH